MNLTKVTNAGTLVMRVSLAFIKLSAAPASPCAVLLLTVTSGRTAPSFNQQNQPIQATNKSFMDIPCLWAYCLGFFWISIRQRNAHVFSSDVHFTVSEFFISSAKSPQSFPTLCDPIDSSPPGSPIPGTLQARTLEWVAISFSSAWKWKVKSESEVSQSCPTPSDPMDCSPPGSSIHGIFQARVLEWGAKSAYKLNKQDDSIQSCCTPFPILNQSFVPYPVLMVASWPEYGFLRRQVRCSGISMSLRIFQTLLWST